MEETRLPRNLGLSLVRATEAAALAAGQWIGLGNPLEADQAATQAMEAVLASIDIDGSIVLGEEDKPEHDLFPGQPAPGGQRAWAHRWMWWWIRSTAGCSLPRGTRERSR